MKVRQAAISDTGRVRAHNEDSYLLREPLFAVADGMGGHEAGEVASAVSLGVLENAIPDTEAPANWLTETLKMANSAVYDAGTQTGGMLRMGTTLTAAYVTDDSIWVGHVGDSRAYLIRDGEIAQLTDDHSLVGEWVRDGRLTVEEAALHPQRSVITRALGIEPDVEVDVSRVTPRTGDRILLCSDGLTGELTDAEICRILTDEADPETAARRLVVTANEHGGEDNITVVVLEVLDAPDVTFTEDSEQAPNAPDSRPSEGGKGDSGTPAGLVLRNMGSGETKGQGGPGDDPGRQGVPGGRQFWIRFSVWAALTLVIVLGGWIALTSYISNSWYVGVHDGNVTVFKGVPEGILGFASGDVVDRTSIPVSLLPATTRTQLEEGIPADDRADADRIVENLREQSTPSTTTTTTTTTTVPIQPAPLPPGTVPP